MTKKERVTFAIEFKNPDKVPIWAFNKDQTKGDILSYELFPCHGSKIVESEWGYTWENLGDGTIGQPKKTVIPDWRVLKKYNFPNPNSSDRFKEIDEFKSKSDCHFLIAEV